MNETDTLPEGLPNPPRGKKGEEKEKERKKTNIEEKRKSKKKTKEKKGMSLLCVNFIRRHYLLCP